MLSWSGSMFEYLMPGLLLRAPPGSLLEQTCRLVVAGRCSTAHERGVPWGMSESAYSARDLEMTYQYSSFGVPGLGLRRGLARRRRGRAVRDGAGGDVRARRGAPQPPRSADAGADGRYGFYEALDYTPSRLPGRHATRGRALVHGPPPGDGDRRHRQRPPRRRHARALPRRAHACGRSELLLQERTPRDVAGGPAPGGRGRGPGRTSGSSVPPARPALHVAARRDAADAAPVQRPLRGDDHRRGLGLQPLARPRGHALARGRDLRRHGLVHLPARRRER